MNSTQPETPPPPPYQERYSTVQPSTYSHDTSIQTISYPKPVNRTSDEVDDCCTDFASCLARTLKNQITYKDRSNPFIQNYHRSKLSCVEAYSYFTICPHNVCGNITFIQPYINDCDTMIIDMHMNISDITKTRYFHHYRGNITTSCAINDLFNYTIIGHVYFGDNHFNGTASVCNDDCVDLYFEGQYKLHASNDTCHNIVTDGSIC